MICFGNSSVGADAWGVEILPTSVKKKREFIGGQLWMIVAGVLALGFLGYHAVRTRSALALAKGQAQVLDAQSKKATATHHRAEE